MKLKLDENFGLRFCKIFEEQGFDTQTVADEKLNGTSDENLFQVCKNENRCLVTLDKDFSDIKRFPLNNNPGIIVIRIQRNPTIKIIKDLILSFLNELRNREIKNSIWIVEPGRIRIRTFEEEY